VTHAEEAVASIAAMALDVASTIASDLPRRDEPPEIVEEVDFTIAGHHWFSYVRFYGPLEPYFGRGWELGDITRVR
jgi:hypothetical protein